MGDGFRVDLSALTKASEGVDETLNSIAKKRVRDIVSPAEAFGHARLATTVAEFTDRWDQGVTNLTQDGQEIAGRLAHCAQVYRETDEAARAHLEGVVVRSAGEDPAAQ